MLEGRTGVPAAVPPGFSKSGIRLKDNLFRDTNTVTRSADELQVEYTTWEIIRRIWREHLRPRLGLLLIASAAMLLTLSLIHI